MAALLVILANPIPPASPGPPHGSPLAAVYGATALAFFFSGCAITLALSAWAGDASRLYFFDLAGAAAGCLLLVPALDLLGAVDTVLLVATLAGAGRRGLRGSRGRPRGAGGGRGGGRGVGRPPRLEPRDRHHRPSRGQGSLRGGNILFSKWNSFSRVTVAGTADPDRQLIMIDADAATILYRDAGATSEKHARQRDRIESLPYHLGGRRERAHHRTRGAEST